MKPMTPWVCVLALASTTVADANSPSEDYRRGLYNQAAAELIQDSKLTAVESDYLGEMYLYGYGVLKNNRRAIQYLTKAALQGFLPAQQLMARYALIHEKNPKEALKWFKKAADQGDLKAQLYCSAAYHFGVGVKPNEDKARYYDILAAKAGNPLAQASLAEHFLESRHHSNKKLGMIWLDKSVDQKEPLGQYLLAKVYTEGKLAPKDLEAAKGLYEAALEGGYLPAMEGLAKVAKLSGDDAGAEKLEAKYKEASDKILDVPEVHAARWLTNGKSSSFKSCGYALTGILTDWTDANALKQNRYNQSPQMAGISRKALYKPNFNMVNPDQVPLTEYYDILVRADLGLDATPLEESRGIDLKALDLPQYPLVEEKHTELLDERATLGDPTAQFALGQFYQQGAGGVKQDIEKAISYYMQAVAQQDLQAEYTLGILYLKGETGKPDYKQAVGWLSDAAFKGNPEAQYVLGRLWEQGLRVDDEKWAIKPDLERAKAMYSLSAFNQNPNGEYHLAEMLVRDKTASLSVQEKQKRHALMKRLYTHAAENGIDAAKLPLAFFDAMENNKEKQEHALDVAKKEAKSGNKQAALLYALLLDRGVGTKPDIGEAIYWYEQSKDNPVSQFVLGTYYATGEGIGENKEKAQELLERAAQSGFAFADLNLAILAHDRGLPYLEHLEKAHQLGNSRASILLADNAIHIKEDENSLKDARVIYTALAERGDRDAQLKLGYLFERGLGGQVDYQNAAHWYELSANQGQSIAQYLLGRLYQMGRLGDLPDYAQAKRWFDAAKEQYAPAAIALGFVYETVDNQYGKAQAAYQLAADKSHPIGEFDLGLIYQYGKGLPADAKQAEVLFLKAEEAGHVRAMVQLGEINLNSTGFRHSHAALEWYEKAAAKGNRDALYQVARMAEKGEGGAKDLNKAVKNYQLATEKGNAEAALALAALYEKGKGVQKNAEEAAKLYQALADRGNGYAQYRLAMLYSRGELGEGGSEKAKHWLKAASENGCVKAEQSLQWLNAQGGDSTSFIEPLSLGVKSARNDG